MFYTVPPESIDSFTASFPRVLLATIPRYSRSMPFFYREKFAVRLQSCHGKVYLGKTSVMKMTWSTLNRLLFPLCFSSSTSDDKIAPKNITDASKLVFAQEKRANLNLRHGLWNSVCRTSIICIY